MCDISINDRFLLLELAEPGEFVVTALDAKTILLHRYPEGEALRKDATSFAMEHAEGQIVRTARAGQILSTFNARHLLTLFKPEGRQVTLGELDDWEKERAALIHAATKQFYANKYIDQRRYNSDYTKTEEDLAAFITKWKSAADRLGLGEWRPSATTIRVLVHNRVGHVSLVDCLRKEPEERKRGIWPQWTYDLADEAIEKVFRRELPSSLEAYKWFYGQFYLERDDGIGIPPPMRQEPPTDRVFRTWFNEASTKKNLERLHGSRKVNKSLKGTIKPQDAVRPLQIVIIDQTLGNIWAAVKRRTDAVVNRALLRTIDDEPAADELRPETLSSKRVEVVYAVDVFSRETLALILTFEPPSIQTFMACLKMVMTPKPQWQARFPDLPDVGDCYGPPETVVLDNLRVHITDSVQLGLLAMNIAIEYAALASPEWKSIVERAIGTCKRVMAELPGGFSIDDDDVISADYQRDAKLDLDELDELVTHKIITEHHMRLHRGTGEPPRLRFANGIKKHGRGMVSDMRQLDLMLRRRKPGILTRRGVNFKGHHFHDESLLSRLLQAFSGETKGAVGDPFTLAITILWKPGDCSSIGVIGPGGKTVVELQNDDPLFANTPVSFEFAAAAKKANQKIFDISFPPVTRAKYMRDFFERLEHMLPKQTHKAGKKTTRLLEGGRAVVIAPDARRYDVIIPVTNLGVSQVDVPIAFATEEGRDAPITPKRRGPKRRFRGPTLTPPIPNWEAPTSYPSYAMSAADSEAYLDQKETEMQTTRH